MTAPGPLILRNDDVNVNTNLDELSEMYVQIRALVPEVQIWSCVTLFAKTNAEGSVYPNAPFKHRPRSWFYNADCFMRNAQRLLDSKIVSHGLYHVDHSQLDRQAQEMSILGSCRYLQTHIFVPPFNRFNAVTLDVCREHGIELIGYQQKWKSLECESFHSNHRFWYFHSWRFCVDEFQAVLQSSAMINS